MIGLGALWSERGRHLLAHLAPEHYLVPHHIANKTVTLRAAEVLVSSKWPTAPAIGRRMVRHRTFHSS